MLAYHNDQTIKDKYITRVCQHREADRLVQGYGYWEDGKGCAVGCTLEAHGGQHRRYETELGIPQVLAHLEDRFFEGLPRKEAQSWPERFLTAIPVGADLSTIWPKFAIWLLTEHRPSKSGKRVAALYARQLDGEIVTRSEWLDARGAALEERRRHYAAYAAAAYAAAAYAADAADAARQRSFTAQSEKLLVLLTETV